MKKSRKRYWLLILVAVFAVVVAIFITMMRSMMYVPLPPSTIDPASEIKVARGSPAPEFTMDNLLDEEVALKDFRGIITVLAFGFSRETAKDVESYRSRIASDFRKKGVDCLKVVHINKPMFIPKPFIRRKMRREFGTEEALAYLVIDWGGRLQLDEKYGIRDKESPVLFIIGRGGRILYACHGWYSEDNVKVLEKEISTILDIGEDAYLEQSAATGDQSYSIGVTRIMFHPCFELCQEGFRTALEEEGYVEGQNVVFDFHDGRADPDEVVRIANKFVSDEVDLIHSMSILGSQLLVEVVKDIPVVYSMVMDPVEERVVPTMKASGTNVTGCAVKYCALADRWPIHTQLETYFEFVPDAKRWGTIFDSSSVNTMFHIRELRQASEDLGLELVEAPIAVAGDVKGAAEDLATKVDAFYIISDGMAMAAFEDISEVCNENKIPLFGGELECVRRGALAAYNQDYFLPGYKAGKLAVRILKGEKAGDIPSEVTQKFHLVISLQNAELQGVTIPEEVRRKADRILS